MRDPSRGKRSAGASVLSVVVGLAIALSLMGDGFARDPSNPPPRKAAKTAALKKPKAAAENRAAGNKVAAINQPRSWANANRAPTPPAPNHFVASSHAVAQAYERRRVEHRAAILAARSRL